MTANYSFLYDELRKAKQQGKPLNFFNLSKDDLSRLWIEEKNADSQIADLFGIDFHAVVRQRKKLGLTLQAAAESAVEDELVSEEHKQIDLLLQTSRVQGMFDVLSENALVQMKKTAIVFRSKNGEKRRVYEFKVSEGADAVSFSVFYTPSANKVRIVQYGANNPSYIEEAAHAVCDLFQSKLAVLNGLFVDRVSNSIKETAKAS